MLHGMYQSFFHLEQFANVTIVAEVLLDHADCVANFLSVVVLQDGGDCGEGHLSFADGRLWDFAEAVHCGLFDGGSEILAETFLNLCDFEWCWRRDCSCRHCGESILR